MDYFTVALLWILWCAVHSGMISLTVTDYLKKRFAGYFRFYRLFYNFFSLITLAPICLYTRAIDGPIAFRWEGYMIILQVALLAIGILLAVAGAKHYDALQLWGIRQIKTGMSHQALSKSGSMKASGILGVTRHPWYLGAMLLLWSVFREMEMPTLIAVIVLTVYLVVGTVLEERKLVVEYGDSYRRYQAKVSMLIPFKWIIKAFHRPS